MKITKTARKYEPLKEKAIMIDGYHAYICQKKNGDVIIRIPFPSNAGRNFVETLIRRQQEVRLPF